MKLLLLLVLIGLSLQATAESDPPALEDLASEGLDSGSKSLQPAPVREKRDAASSSNLKWVRWTGSLPSDAVGIYNSYDKRYDYVCKAGCHAGFYSSSKGSYCYYAYGGKEKTYSNFQVLVNKDNFELLKWEEGSKGSVPANSVESGCPGYYVGKNKYGLGKVHVKNKAFFLPRDGKEKWYKSYDVLTSDPDVNSQSITNVKYSIDQEKVLTNPPESMRSSSVINNACRPVKKTVTLSKTLSSEKRWDAGASLTVGVSTSVTAGVPDVASVTTEFSVESTMSLSAGGTKSSSKTHSISVEVMVPPNHKCTVHMTGYKYQLDIPFTATLTRTYKSKETRSRQITGTYENMDYGDIQAVVDRCTLIPNALPCPSK